MPDKIPVMIIQGAIAYFPDEDLAKAQWRVIQPKPEVKQYAVVTKLVHELVFKGKPTVDLPHPTTPKD